MTTHAVSVKPRPDVDPKIICKVHLPARCACFMSAVLPLVFGSGSLRFRLARAGFAVSCSAETKMRDVAHGERWVSKARRHRFNSGLLLPQRIAQFGRADECNSSCRGFFNTRSSAPFQPDKLIPL